MTLSKSNLLFILTAFLLFPLLFFSCWQEHLEEKATILISKDTECISPTQVKFHLRE